MEYHDGSEPVFSSSMTYLNKIVKSSQKHNWEDWTDILWGLFLGIVVNIALLLSV